MDHLYENKNDRKNCFDGLEDIMYGFGDSKSPDRETRDLMEQMLIDFYDKIIREAHKRSHSKGVGK